MYVTLVFKTTFLEEFAAFEWSPDETKVLYVAEKKQQEGEEFYKRKLVKDSIVEEIEKLNEKVVKSW